jgi:hypothetical protein
VDLTAIKRFSYRERYSFEFQAIAYNVLNHPQYTTGPVNSVGGAPGNNGQFTTYVNPASPQFELPKTNFGSNARSMILVGKLRF